MKRIAGLIMAVIMALGTIPVAVYADGTVDGLDASIEFSEEYLKVGANEYLVFGKNNSSETKTIQTVRALYRGGTLVSLDYGAPFSVGAGESYEVSESVMVPNGTDISNSLLNVYIWDGKENISPISKSFGQRAVSFSFTLTENATTSAGVYDKDGVLVRTLWSAVPYEAGTYTEVWDGLDDELNLLDGGNYTVKVLSHNIKYSQDALLANSTAREKADTMITGYQPISDMTLLGEKMYYADQYMENYYTLMYFNINDIHRKAGYFEKNGNRVPIRNANDGKTVYWMMFESTQANGEYYDESIWGNRRCFIMGVDVATNTQKIFAHGQYLRDYWGVDRPSQDYGYKSAIGYEPYFADEEVGHYGSSGDIGYGDLEVQQNGNFLVATYGNRDFVRVMNKTTGQVLKDNPLSSPISMAFDTKDRLWVAYKNASGNYAVSRFNIASDGTMTLAESMPSSNIKGETLGMAFSPDGTYVAFVFGDGADKIYAYNLSDWSTKWTFGRGEDYSIDPTVYDDKFCFRDTAGKKEYSYLTFQGNDYLWVGDPGNSRNRKLDVRGATPTIADTIWYTKQHYACEVDTNDPTRVFLGHMEFKIDYSKAGDESWTLVRNYVDTVAPYVNEGTGGMLDGLTTMPNGRTYFAGVIKENLTQGGSQYELSTGDKVIFELTDTGIINTGIIVNGWSVLKDGKLTLQKAEDCNLNNVSGRALYQRAFIGFDSENKPIWSDKKMVAFMSDAEGSWNQLASDTAITENNIVFPVQTGYYSNVFRTQDNMRDFRMGGFKASTDADTKWLFKTAPATTNNYGLKAFPRDGAVEINTWYDLSGEGQAYGEHVITHYRGEGSSIGGQCNIFYHYLDNGLLVGVYGNGHSQQAEYENYNQLLVNGNGMVWSMAFPDGKDSDTAYIYQGGEARMCGVVRTKVTGLNSIKTVDIPVSIGSPYRSGVNVKSYNKADCSNTSEISNAIRYNFELPKDVTSRGSAKFETYIKAPQGDDEKLPIWIYTDGQVEISYDNEKIVSGSGVLAKNIEAKCDDYKKLVIWVTPKDGVLSYFDLKTEIDGKKQDIPRKYLYAIPGNSYADKVEFDLLEGLPFDTKIEEGNIAGWDFNNWKTDKSSAITNYASYDYELGSSLTLYGYIVVNENLSATRDLGNAISNMSSWEIDTTIMMNGYPNGYYYSEYPTAGGNYPGEQGKYFDILDSNGKIISRITMERDMTLRLNGAVIMQTDNKLDYLSRNYFHELSLPSELKISVASGKVTASYRGNSVTTGVYESGAAWNKPKTLKVSLYKRCVRGPHPVEFTTDFITLKYTQYK